MRLAPAQPPIAGAATPSRPASLRNGGSRCCLFRVTAPTHQLRPADFERDLPFLRALYASTREAEFAATGMPRPQVDALLGQQFEAQHAHYRRQFTGAEFDLVLDRAGEPIGRLYLDERDDELRVIDIALLPGSRGRGIGGAILRDVLDRARRAGKAVRVHVERTNAALRLYLRLGFELVEDRGAYLLMEWDAGRSGG